jgi:2-polyprenyl-3-methyl-5-hydroxy-6-metoxy-1,4-benzoquinol methylase
MVKIVISCVVDNHPKYIMQCWNWLASLHAVGSFDRAEIVVHHTPQVATEDLRFFEQMGAKLSLVQPFGHDDARFCNKIRQLETNAFQDADYVILSDTDIVFADCPTQYANGNKVKGKIVDLPNPPLSVCEDIISRAGIRVGCHWVKTDFSPFDLTIPTNFNGGLYIIPAVYLSALRTAWQKWAYFCLNQSDILGPWKHHADQLGFALAMLENNLPFEALKYTDNFPTHFGQECYNTVVHDKISAFHYHNNLDASGYLQPIGIKWVDAQIDAVNCLIAPFRRRTFNNRIFWDFRYKDNPELGSGVGSRGEVLDYKRRLIAPYMKVFADSRITDIGCGDIEATRHSCVQNYLGVDQSSEAISIARGKRPDWEFSTTNISEIDDDSADLVICLDLLIHIRESEHYNATINDLIRISSSYLIVSGYDENQGSHGMIFFHESLSKSLKRHDSINNVFELGRYRDVVVFLAEKKSENNVHDNDISVKQLSWGIMETMFNDTLLGLVSLSRRKIGFFPKTIIRTIEYPWFAKQMEDASGQTILDVGAGVNVLPFWLADKGAHVVTIDSHPNSRSLSEMHKWNEWGFLDYSMIDKRIKSIHGDVMSFDHDALFDFIYSVSVVEHMSAINRRASLARLAPMLKQGGRLLLSVDLVPGEDALWPLSEGENVDDEGMHGSMWNLMDEIRSVNLTILEWVVRREIPESRTDLLFVIAVRSEDNPETGKKQPPYQSTKIMAVKDLQREVEQLLHSRSWRLTKPLRKICGIIRQLSAPKNNG